LALAAFAKPLQPFHGKFGTYRNVFGVANHERYLAMKNLPTIACLRTLPGFDDWAEKFFREDVPAFECAVPHFDICNTMVNSQLPASDLGGMRASHEIRTPYLNYRLQELVAGMDMRSFLAFGQKSVLRRLLKRYLPSKLVDQPKRGFKFPVDRFLNQLADDVPVVTGIPASTTREIWHHRQKPGWQRLALRVALLSAFEAWRPEVRIDASIAGTSASQ